MLRIGVEQAPPSLKPSANDYRWSMIRYKVIAYYPVSGCMRVDAHFFPHLLHHLHLSRIHLLSQNRFPSISFTHPPSRPEISSPHLYKYIIHPLEPFPQPSWWMPEKNHIFHWSLICLPACRRQTSDQLVKPHELPPPLPSNFVFNRGRENYTLQKGGEGVHTQDGKVDR